jgi:hypothetical protein
MPQTWRSKDPAFRREIDSPAAPAAAGAAAAGAGAAAAWAFTSAKGRERRRNVEMGKLSCMVSDEEFSRRAIECVAVEAILGTLLVGSPFFSRGLTIEVTCNVFCWCNGEVGRP